MTSKKTIDVFDPSIKKVLEIVAVRAGAKKEEGISQGWILAQSAPDYATPGWIIAATKKILTREFRPCGDFRIDDIDNLDEFENHLSNLSEINEVRDSQNTKLPQKMEEMIDGGTAGLAKKLRVTRRRAQQIFKKTIDSIADGDLFGDMGMI